uniref:Uncharacterized protein n=1 Tax=Picea sitchensis TaxID=3332 RepID=A0A6B9XUW4_PICSI|nr:hypothetical protein Q903MT_gene6749 [Picea sitchensis]
MIPLHLYKLLCYEITVLSTAMKRVDLLLSLALFVMEVLMKST